MTEEPDPALEEALRRLERDTAGPLAAWSDARQAEVEAVVRETTSADRGLSVRVIEEAAGRRPRRRFGPGLVAAGLAAGLALGYFGRGTFEREQPAQPDRTLLGGGRGASIAVHPPAAVDHYDFFAWSGGVDRQRYGLRVWNDGELDAALSVDGLTKSFYEPTPEERARLGPAIRWEVVAQDAYGSSLGTLFTASSSRSP